MKTIKFKKKNVQIFTLYFFLTAGGLWHVLNVLQTTMRILAAPLIFGLAVWVSWDFYQNFSPDQKNQKNRFLAWVISVFVLSYLIELVGVKTGYIFGSNQYGDTLQPKLFGVPLAIGCALVVMLLSATAILQKLASKIGKFNLVLQALIIALLMVIFDLVMEPAAMKLNYWNWSNGIVPMQNYLAWFVISFLFILPALKCKLFEKTSSDIALHAYVAQFIYFVFIIFK